MAALMLDTHVAVWLYAGNVERLSNTAKTRLDSDPLWVSPMVVLELQYLHEIGRLTVGAETVIAELTKVMGIRVCSTPIERVVQAGLSLAWTRDPFDRLIVAQSLVEQMPLLTADELIRRHAPHAIWD
jgi:PIN domain nuclease of toxin-antitoxin system